MDQPNLERNDVQSAAHAFVAQGEEFLQATLQREFTLTELGEFSKVAGATILGTMFSILRAHPEVKKEDADAWLKKALGLMSSWVRMQGSDALVVVDLSVKDAPNRLKRMAEEQQKKAELPVGPTTCQCKRTADGSCPECARAMSAGYRKVFGLFRQMGEATQASRGPCSTCRMEAGDAVLSLLVPELLAMDAHLAPEARAASIQDLYVAMRQLAATNGILEIPITEKALETAVKS